MPGRALARFDTVETVGFDYGQRHQVELSQRPIFRRELSRTLPGLARPLGADHRLDARVLKDLGETAMTHDVAIETCRQRLTFHLCARAQSFIPHARRRAGGAARHWRAGRAACARPIFPAIPIAAPKRSRAQETTLSLGLGSPMRIETPLMELTKAQTWALRARARRRRAGRSDSRTHPHLLSRRPRDAPRLGLWLRRRARPVTLRAARLARLAGGRR